MRTRLSEIGQMTRTNDQNNEIGFSRFQDHLEGKEGQILLGAFESIIEKGISKTTIRSIGQKAGLNPGIIHYYFKNKDELLSRVLSTCYNNAIANLESLNSSSLSPLQKVERLVDLGLTLFGPRKDDWTVITAFWAHTMSRDSVLTVIHRKLNRRFQAAMIKVMKGCLDDSDLKTIKGFASLLIGTIEGLALQHVLDPESFDSEHLAGLVKRLFGKALLQSE
jgi:TetR/AcrR family transcriptional repressor of bet genes